MTMTVTRRGVALGLAALGVAGCGAAPAPAPRRPEVLRAVPNPAFDAWVAAYRDRAAARGVPAPVIARAFAGAGYLPGVVERDRNQPESTRTLEDYLAIAASDQKVADGRAARARYAAVLERVGARYGVDPAVVTAIWGLESNYGTRRGDIPVISALSTLAYDGRRGVFFERQLDAALGILARGDITPERMTGSWAGAMGHTQFIPTSYQAYAVDFTGDGRRDIWSDDPTDALASTAAYLQRSGWQTGAPWGGEAGSPGAAAGGSRLQPQPGGPVFVVGRNFDVIKRYNNSDSYAIGVGHLADRIRGAGPLRAGFPPDANGLTIDQRRELQRRLTAAGFDTGGADGVIGPATRDAIRAFQLRAGLAVTGEPSPALLARLG